MVLVTLWTSTVSPLRSVELPEAAEDTLGGGLYIMDAVAS